MLLTPLSAQAAFGQESSANVQTVVDNDLFVAPRTSAMAGAYAPFATNLDAIMQNPAGIGGYPAKGPSTFVRQLHFPYGGVALNENSQALRNDFSKQGGANDSEIGSAIIDAYAGKRQFARASIVPNVVLSRLMILPILDQQIAAVPTGAGTDDVSVLYRGTYGIGAGLSVSDPAGNLTLGVFGSSLSVQQVKGNVLYSSVINAEERSTAIKDISTSYSGSRTNAGLTYKFGKTGITMISVAVRDLGKSRLDAKSGQDQLTFEDDWSLAFGIKPKLGKSMTLNYAMQVDSITNDELSIVEKLKTGIEFLYGDNPERPLAGLRAGYNYSGLCGGLDINLGLIGLQAASCTQDIGVGNARVVERRNEISIMIELVE
jgi:hypothetical protein